MLLSKNSSTIENAHQRTGRAPGGPARRAHDERVETIPVVVIASAVAALRGQWREGIRRFVTAEVTDHAELTRIMTQRKPTTLLLDSHLPQLGGISGVAALRRLQPTTKIVLLASVPDEKEGIAALKMGVRGYCDIGISRALLGKALEAVRDGEIWVGRKLTSHLLEELNSLAQSSTSKTDAIEVNGRLRRLTPRERDIVDLLGIGASNKDIAQRLAVTERTVKAHLTA